MRLAPAPSQEDDSIDVKKKASPIPLRIFRGTCEVGRRRLVFDTKKSTKIKWVLEKSSAENVFQAAVRFYSRGTPRSRRHTVKCRLGPVAYFHSRRRVTGNTAALCNFKSTTGPVFGASGHRSAGHGHNRVFKFSLRQLLEAVFHLHAPPPLSPPPLPLVFAAVFKRS